MELVHRYSLKNLKIVVAISLVLFWPSSVLAQCNWENWNCTPTPEPTPTGTITPIATSTINPVVFQPPQYDVPTSIPPLIFPTAPPALQFTPIPPPAVIEIDIPPVATPDYPSMPITPSDVISLSTLNTTINLSITTPLTLTFDLTETSLISGISGDVEGWITNDLISYTGYLTGQIASIQGSETITVITAPSWYAPALPRPMANVGWTFEQLSDPTGEIPNFTLNSWSGFFGYVASLPFQFIKMWWQFVAYLGPLGLFLGWLMIMFVIVLVIHFQAFIVKTLIALIHLVLKLVELVKFLIPFFV